MTVLAVALFAGCSKQTTDIDVLSDQLKIQEDQIADLQDEIRDRNRDLEQTREEAEQASSRTVEIPPEYETVRVRQMVEPSREVRTPVVAESYMEWRQVLCETNMSNVTVQKIQRALQAKGHNPGPLDGIYGLQTQAAVKSYQKAGNLPVGALGEDARRRVGRTGRGRVGNEDDQEDEQGPSAQVSSPMAVSMASFMHRRPWGGLRAQRPVRVGSGVTRPRTLWFGASSYDPGSTISR